MVKEILNRLEGTNMNREEVIQVLERVLQQMTDKLNETEEKLA